MAFNFEAWLREEAKERMKIYGRPKWIRWRRELFKFVCGQLKIREKELWNRIAKLKKIHHYWLDDTCLLEIAKDEGIEIPERLFVSYYFTISRLPRKAGRNVVALGKAP